MDKKYPYIALYLLGYVILALTTTLPLFIYFMVLATICKVLSGLFANVITTLSKTVKPVSWFSLRGGLFTGIFGFLSITLRNYYDAQCVFIAVFGASIVFPTIVDAIRMLYVKDPHWLTDSDDYSVNPDGHIGIANTISVVRIAIAAVLPLVFIWLNSEQGRTMCFIVLVVIILSDWVDGHIARLTKTVTKAGKYLDPLGDKVLFIPNSIAFIIVLAMRGVLNSHLVLLLAIALLITVARDILFFIWFATKSKQYSKGVGAGFIDKARMVAICCWLIVTANLVTLDFLHDAAIVLGVVFVSLMAILSGMSVVVDIQRLKEVNQ